MAGSVMPGWSAGVASWSLAASAEISSGCASSLSGSGAGGSGVVGVVSGVEVELTDIGGSSVAGGSLILDAGGGTDVDAAVPAVWLNRAPSWSPVRQTWLPSDLMAQSCFVATLSNVALVAMSSLVVKVSAKLANYCARSVSLAGRFFIALMPKPKS